MRLLLQLLLSLAIPLASLASAKVDNCAKCHTDLDDTNAKIVADYQQDIHFLKGFNCADCHGGDASLTDEEAMDPDRGFIGIPPHKDIPSLCGKCHSDANFMRRYNPALHIDQVEKYYTSHHGMLLKNGDNKVATCTSCHGVHGILPPDDSKSPVNAQNVPQTCNHCHGNADYMKPYGIPTNQFKEYSESVHGVALLEKKTKGAPGCNDCHGNHGAAPPGVNDVEAVCVTCHSFNGELYSKSPHMEAFQEAGLAQCAACHDHHAIKHPTDDMLGVGEGGICADCHSAGEPAYVEAAAMKALLDSLIEGQTRAKASLAEAAVLDMDVAEGEVAVEKIRENVIEGRTAIHAFSVDHLRDVIQDGFAAEAEAESLAAAAIYEYKFRRTGFGIATLILTGFALLIWLFIRKIERVAD